MTELLFPRVALFIVRTLCFLGVCLLLLGMIVYHFPSKNVSTRPLLFREPANNKRSLMLAAYGASCWGIAGALGMIWFLVSWVISKFR